MTDPIGAITELAETIPAILAEAKFRDGKVRIRLSRDIEGAYWVDKWVEEWGIEHPYPNLEEAIADFGFMVRYYEIQENKNPHHG